MAPHLDLLGPSRTSLIAGRRQAGSEASDDDDEVAQLERTYQESRIRAGEEVEVFAKWLDECTLAHGGTPSEKRTRVFKLVNNYYGYTQDKANMLRKRQRLEKSAGGGAWDLARTEQNDMDLDETDEERQYMDQSDELRKWESEAQTWDLLRRLLPLRYSDGADAKRSSKPGTTPQTRQKYWDEFMLSDSVAKERKAVLEWLQSNASTGPDIDELVKEYQQKADRGDIVAMGWLHTKTSIKMHKRMGASSHVLGPQSPAVADFQYVTQLDPDVMTRQGRKLDPHDEYFERAIWLGCFQLLRRGRSMKEIRDWCLERTEAWRAATISALPLSNPDDEEQPDFDPVSTVLWRRMCYALVKQGGSDDLERAVYGVLSGDIASVEKVCKTWDDFLFANYNALLRTQFDSYLIKQCGPDSSSTVAQALPAFNAVQFHGEPSTVGRRLISSLESDSRTAKEAKTVTKALQGAILSGNLDNYIYQQGLALSADANQHAASTLIPGLGANLRAISGDENAKFISLSDHDGLRLIAHILIVVLALDSIDAPTRDLAGPGPFQTRHLVQEYVIAGYVSFLRLANLEELIPLYCSKLYGSKRYSTLSQNLIQVTDREAQLTQLNLMQRLGLDIETFLKDHPQIFLSQLPRQPGLVPAKSFRILEPGPPTIKFGRIVKPDFFAESDELDRPLEYLIRSVEWLLLSEGLLLETCEYGIKVYKYFLKNLHLDAARTFSQRVSIADVIRQKTGKDISDELEPSWVEEIFGQEPILPDEMIDDTVEERFGAPRARLANAAKNMWELESLVKALDNIETISGFAELAREQSHSTDKSYVPTFITVLRLVKINMQPLLRGWLLESNEDDKDFQALREAYLPETVMAYVSTLQFAGTSLARDNLLEAMELAAIVAEKDSDLGPLFVKTSRMKELVECFASCSKALAIWTGDHKKGSTSSKKLREMGWSRELWSVKP
ncbi:Nucleoporin NUP84 [Pleurostoma richardsiae]|uniref:Nuclear pore complex protein n=1 Tax=Pleurostoma richardsiae TaxID=41990 RepID=A0AA38SCX3_9PEZI|nr:Nucleoporin NUP84 [Pleurostoma richardsiae]